MASRFSSRQYNSLARFRQLIPPPSSVSQRLAFHTTPRNQILDTCLGYSHSALMGLHSVTGLSWAATIPLFALILRVFWVNPLMNYTNQIHQRKLLLQPTILAWIPIIRKKVFHEHAHLGPEAVERISQRAVRLKLKEIYTRRGIKFWKSLLPVVQFPVFLLISETLRRMSGMGLGILGLLAGRFNSEPAAEAEELIEHPMVPLGHSVDANLADNSMSLLVGRSDSESAAEELIEHRMVPLEHSVDANLVDNSMDLFEPSFASEGALWFPDLLLPDPTLCLSLILFVSLYANVTYHAHVAPAQTKWGHRYYKILRILAFASGPLTIPMPTAILVYWISTSLVGLGHFTFRQWYKPHMPRFRPCKPRHLRVLLGCHQEKQRDL